MRVLHDWDSPRGAGGPAFRRAIQLLIFAASKKFRFIRRLKLKQVEAIHMEVRAYADTLAMLDDLAGVTPIFGIRDRVEEKYPGIKEHLRETYGVDVRRHIHIGKNSDPNRIRTWEPLDGLEGITRNVWHFDKRYFQGRPVTLQPGEIPVWHVDCPSFLPLYIKYLYEEKHRCE